MTKPTMSQQSNPFSVQSEPYTGPVVTPCTAQCINLQAMHPHVLHRLGLRYKQYYTIIRYEVNPTPQHLGDWVQLAGIGKMQPDGSRERIPASFFYINSVVWPN